MLLTALCLLGLCRHNLFAQDTYYYKQIKVVRDKQTIATGKGGQFISFFSDICYDSDNMGTSIDNGRLERVSRKGDKYTKYKGTSYWGNVTYQFTTDLKKLAVIKQDGTIYVYERSIAPSGVTTCSLIKSKSSSNYSGEYIHIPPTNYPPNNYNEINSTTTISNSQKSGKTTSRFKCYHCNETGERIINPSDKVATFGLDNHNVKEYCSKCGQYFQKGTHAHIFCGYCGGKGYTEVRY